MTKLVFEEKLIDYHYFMDELEGYELELLSENYINGSKTSWEQTRFLSYNIISPYLKKSARNKSIEELFPLPFDNDNKYKVYHKGTGEEREKIFEAMSKINIKEIFKQQKERKDERSLEETLVGLISKQ